MLNVVVLIGRLVRDPELRYTPAGVAVGKFTVAVDRSFTTSQGERGTDFIDVVLWRRLAETCASHLGKGRLVAVEGRLQVRSYETQDGQKRRVSEVVARSVTFLDRPRENTGQTGETGLFGEEADFPEDDIPF